MKTTKRVLAVVLTVLMLALMIPFAVSAEETAYKATIEGKQNYGVTFVKIATYNDATGKYVPVGTDKMDASIRNLLGGNDGTAEITAAQAANIRTAIEKAMVEKKPYGDAEGRSTVDFTNKEGKWVAEFGTDNAGIYYAAVTKSPSTANSTGGSLFYLADAKTLSGVSMATANETIKTKLSEGSVTVDKKIGNSTMSNDYQTTASTQDGDEVTFNLTTTVPGSKTEYLTKYTVHDIMSDKLTFAGKDSVSVTVGGAALTKGALTGTTESGDFYVVDDSQSDIQIVFTQAYLTAARTATTSSDAKYQNFYAANTKVVTTLKATVNANSQVGRVDGDTNTDFTEGEVGNWNKDKLTWTNRNNQSDEQEGNTVHVYTFNVPIIKVKNGTTTGLQNAVFTLKGENLPAAGINVTTGSNGKATFEKLRAGSYTLTETTAPNGYNKITKSFTVTIDATTGEVTVTDLEKDGDGNIVIPNTPVVMPATGGQGTMIFTIVGASLIACAGILFIIVRRKKSSK